MPETTGVWDATPGCDHRLQAAHEAIRRRRPSAGWPGPPYELALSNSSPNCPTCIGPAAFWCHISLVPLVQFERLGQAKVRNLDSTQLMQHDAALHV